MPNFLQTMWNNTWDSFAKAVASYIPDQLTTRYGILANYYTGDHRPQLKRKDGQMDDNVIQNFIGLSVDRSVSRMFRGDVVFSLPKGATKQQEYIDAVWKANKKQLLLYQLGLHGSNFGTCFVEIVPDKLADPLSKNGELFPRLVPLYPPVIRIVTNPQDVEQVMEYRIEYKIKVEEKETAYRKIARPAFVDEGIEQMDGTMDTNYWVITLERKQGSAAWELLERTLWQYDFPPIHDWKNLPSLNSAYGDADIDDAINIQDKNNFVVSNTGKIVKHHASPRTIFTGVKASQIEKVDDSPESALVIPTGADAKNLEIQSDLASSRAFAQDLQQSIFDITREVNPSDVSDRLGQLTNFGIRVMYQDAMDKNNTKRKLYGDALLEINRRLLVLKGWTAEESDPGTIQWGEALPVDIVEEMNTDKIAMNDLKIVDRETVYKRYKDRYGVDWEDMKKKLEAEQNERQKEQERIFGTGSNNGGTGGDGMEGGDEQGNPDGQGAQKRRVPPVERMVRGR